VDTSQLHIGTLSGGGGITPIRAPVLPYVVNGTVLDSQPSVTTAPLSLAGAIIPAGSTFVLIFFNVSPVTQNLLIGGTTVTMQFGLPDQSSATGQVLLSPVINTGNPPFVTRAFGSTIVMPNTGVPTTQAFCTIVQTIQLNRYVIVTQFF